jgi:predicted nucleotidyltransferase component of viral defense system
MISKNEIALKSKDWGVSPETVDKDYVLGHFLSVFCQYFDSKLLFKGGTCLRKCYYSDYRFSEDLDFSSKKHDFVLRGLDLDIICRKLKDETDILFHPEEILPIISKDVPKGYQVKVKYWGANHSKHVQPTHPNRWATKIKLEISTEELCIFPGEHRNIIHLYSDKLVGADTIQCYSIYEIVCEKLRSLVQRSYSAPRDIYDLYHLTQNFTQADWRNIRSAFITKMGHKNFQYTGPDLLINEEKIQIFLKAWDASVAHQITEQDVSKENQVNTVYKLIHDNL